MRISEEIDHLKNELKSYTHLIEKAKELKIEQKKKLQKKKKNARNEKISVLERDGRMKNKEKFAKEIVEIAVNGGSLAINGRTSKLCSCGEISCQRCTWGGVSACRANVREWAEAEYVELIKLTKAEKTILESIDKEYEWIARDRNNMLCIYPDKPHKENETWYGSIWFNLNMFSHLFQFIKWEDEEPYKISDILENCEVEE